MYVGTYMWALPLSYVSIAIQNLDSWIWLVNWNQTIVTFARPFLQDVVQALGMIPYIDANLPKLSVRSDFELLAFLDRVLALFPVPTYKTVI